MQLVYIEKIDDLIDICAGFAQQPLLSIDTEFVRTNTFFPKLGLIQVCDGHQVVLIDPVAIEDLSVFWQLLENENIIKLLHAGSEDLEIFNSIGHVKPVNLYDTQVFMAFLGHGISLGYAAMVEHFHHVALDKSESRTNWLKRPLTEKQIQYAADDVNYLYLSYAPLIAALTAKGLDSFAKEECQRLIDKKYSTLDEDSLFLQVKGCGKLAPKQLHRLKYLAKWRYQQAIKRDLPLSFVAKDHTLLSVAEHNPTHVGAMASIDSIHELDVRHQGKRLINELKKVPDVESSEYPQRIKRLDQISGYKKCYASIKNLLVELAEKAGIPMEVVASKKQINQVLSWYYGQTSLVESQVDLLTGWRAELFSDAIKKQLN